MVALYLPLELLSGFKIFGVGIWVRSDAERWTLDALLRLLLKKSLIKSMIWCMIASAVDISNKRADNIIFCVHIWT